MLKNSGDLNSIALRQGRDRSGHKGDVGLDRDLGIFSVDRMKTAG